MPNPYYFICISNVIVIDDCRFLYLNPSIHSRVLLTLCDFDLVYETNRIGFKIYDYSEVYVNYSQID